MTAAVASFSEEGGTEVEVGRLLRRGDLLLVLLVEEGIMASKLAVFRNYLLALAGRFFSFYPFCCVQSVASVYAVVRLFGLLVCFS